MKFRAIGRLVGWVLGAIGGALLLCAGVGRGMGDPTAAVFSLGASGVGALAAGAALGALCRWRGELTRREGIAAVVAGWVAASLAGAVPFRLSGAIPTWTAAIFETVSGLTTTGASVLARPETLPRGLLLWRSMTHFIGGMGVLLLFVAVLPLVGTGGMQLFRAEMTGPTKDRLTPRIAGTAKRLWAVYLVLNAAEIVALRLAGMGWFDAVCHSFATIATGGFSTRSESLGAFTSPAIHWIVIVFMMLSGVNFALHYRAGLGRFDVYARDSEFKLYLLVLTVSTVVVCTVVWSSRVFAKPADALRHAAFTVISIATSTGFTTVDYDQWPALARWVLFLLMFVGGCAGSTSGSIKVVRVLIALRLTAREVFRWLQPEAVVSVKVDREAVDPPLLMNVMVFILLYLMVFAAGSLLMGLHFGADWISAASSVATCMGNIGPGFGAVGPSLNYSSIPSPGLALLTVLMLLGRLELFTVLVLFVPAFWRR
ncbi:MAG: TrkH family potassium uptake protein [Kiritimatiellae bacterium]|nr:TrkH family potassium uptake protein [Kiritimatiellia bacterium]